MLLDVPESERYFTIKLNSKVQIIWKVIYLNFIQSSVSTLIQ